MDYDFITTCNWTSTGTYTLQAFRGSGTNVASSFTLYYRKKGTSTWNSTTNGEINITSTGASNGLQAGLSTSNNSFSYEDLKSFQFYNANPALWVSYIDEKVISFAAKTTLYFVTMPWVQNGTCSVRIDGTKAYCYSYAECAYL